MTRAVFYHHVKIILSDHLKFGNYESNILFKHLFSHHRRVTQRARGHQMDATGPWQGCSCAAHDHQDLDQW